MNIQVKPLATAILAASLISSCAVTPYSEQDKYQPLQTKPTPMVVERSATYLREVTPDEAILSRKVNFSGRVALIDALRKQLVGINIVPGDQNVKLDREIRVFAQDMLLSDYLDYLESVTGYDIELKQNVVTVRSFIQREWNLATFASKRSVELKVGSSFNTENTTVTDNSTTTTGGGNNIIEGKFDVDEWSVLVEGAKSILNVSSGSSDKQKSDLLEPYVQAVRSVGTLNVGGEVSRVNALDGFIGNLIESGQKQVNINVQAYDVNLKDDRGAGIDWQQLADVSGSINSNPLNITLESIAGDEENRLLDSSEGLFQTNIVYNSSEVKADALVRFLSKFGDVELLNQPNVTVRNGSYAYISTGQELTFVGEIETREVGDNGFPRTTGKLSSVRVGVTLAVTPRVLGDGRIMLEIWPVISSLNGERKYTFSDNTFEVPIIALNELSTEVITESGKPIQLGGFISRAIETNLQGLPWRDRVTKTLVNPIFRSERNKLDRRELVLTVTPTIVEGV